MSPIICLYVVWIWQLINYWIYYYYVMRSFYVIMIICVMLYFPYVFGAYRVFWWYIVYANPSVSHQLWYVTHSTISKCLFYKLLQASILITSFVCIYLIMSYYNTFRRHWIYWNTCFSEINKTALFHTACENPIYNIR